MDSFQENFEVHLEVGVANGGAFKVVPTGKTAVIEHASVQASGEGAATADYFISSTIGGDSAFREVPIVTQGGHSGRVVGSHPLRAFAASDTQFGGVIRRLSTTGDVRATFVLAGFYAPV
jgi:hypothetical protein